MTNEQTLRHPNGGALKIGTEVHVSPDSLCDAESQISGMSSIFQSIVQRSNVESSHLFNTVFDNGTGIGSICAQSRVCGVYLEGCILDRVIAENGIYSGKLTLIEVVAETCELYGDWELRGNGRIHEGVWHRSPRFRRITGDNGVNFGLTECKPGYAMMGCWCKPITELLKAGPRLGRKHGWTGEQIRAAKEFYEEIGDVKLEGVRA